MGSENGWQYPKRLAVRLAVQSTVSLVMNPPTLPFPDPPAAMSTTVRPPPPRIPAARGSPSHSLQKQPSNPSLPLLGFSRGPLNQNQLRITYHRVHWRRGTASNATRAAAPRLRYLAAASAPERTDAGRRAADHPSASGAQSPAPSPRSSRPANRPRTPTLAAPCSSQRLLRFTPTILAADVRRHGRPARPPWPPTMFATARIRSIRAGRRPPRCWRGSGIVRPTFPACARRRQGASLRSALLRGALGLDAGSAHVCPDRQLSDDAQP